MSQGRKKILTDNIIKLFANQSELEDLLTGCSLPRCTSDLSFKHGHLVHLVAEGGTPPAYLTWRNPLTDQNYLNFMQFFCKILWNFMLVPPLFEGWRPSLREVLNSTLCVTVPDLVQSSEEEQNDLPVSVMTPPPPNKISLISRVLFWNIWSKNCSAELWSLKFLSLLY